MTAKTDLWLALSPILDSRQKEVVSKGIENLTEDRAKELYEDIRTAFNELPEAVGELNAALDEMDRK